MNPVEALHTISIFHASSSYTSGPEKIGAVNVPTEEDVDICLFELCRLERDDGVEVGQNIRSLHRDRGIEHLRVKA